jgi:hypothetical protein
MGRGFKIHRPYAVGGYMKNNKKRVLKTQCEICGEWMLDYELFINGHACKPFIKNVWLFPNGMIAVCNLAGQQVPSLQGPYTEKRHKEITKYALPNCEWKGLKPYGNEN